MNKIFFLGLIFCALNFFGQSDGCSAATVIGVSANCSSPTAGSTTGATQTIAGCVGTADDDVWYQFTATSTSHQIEVDGAAGFDPVVQLFSGGCSVLASIDCQDATLDGGVETIYATGLTIGNVYRIRVYHYFAGSGTGNFTICITVPPPPPSNDLCSNAIGLTVNGSCVNTSGTSLYATDQGVLGCAGTADDDVWYSFTATNSVQTITVSPSGTMDPVVQLYSGSCGSLSSLDCEDSGFSGDTETISAVGLTPGNLYFVRVYDYFNANGGGGFDICVTGTPTAVPTNDEPCNAISLPTVTSACNYLNFTTVGATASLGAPTPSTCVGGGGAAIGGFSASSADVWFSVVAPSSGELYITPQPNFGITDGVMVLYSGTCGALTQIVCSDDNNYPGGANDLLPYIAETGLTPGATYFIRYFGFGTTTGDFGLCVSAPTNDNCSNALYICDINGYSASTSAAYTADRPCNMHGNNETNAGVDQPDGTNTGGIFGQGGAWGTGSPLFDVNIDNNSWIEFTAGATSATLTVSVYDCWVGGYPSGGIQMQVFSGTNCCSFVPVSNFEENSTGFTITANGLTVGQNYYLMVDGFAGDICSYTINANTGVLFPDITSTPNPICSGESTTLTAPSGATGYTWYPGGQTTQAITVSPGATTTYTCIVDGVCGYKQTLTETIVVNQLPNITSANTNAICSGENVGYSITSDLSSSYSWVATSNANVSGESTVAQSGNSISDVLTTSATTPQIVEYTITPTSSNGCVGSPYTVSITVNPLATMDPISPSTICSGDQLNVPLSSNLSSTYSWVANANANVTGESTTPQSANPLDDILVNTTTGAENVVYTITPTTTVGGCQSPSQNLTITVNPNPVANAGGDITIDCNNTSDDFVATGGGTYSWNTPSGVVSGSTVNVTSASPSGNYTVTVTNLGCTDTDVASLTIDVGTPTANIAAPPMIDCSNPNITVDGSSSTNESGGVTGLTYAWTTSNGGNISGASNAATVTAAAAGDYTLTVTQANGCSDSQTVTVMADASVPVADAGSANDLNCTVTQLTLDGSNSSGTGLTFGWVASGGGNIVSGGSTDSPVIDQPGTYTLTITASNGCSNSDAIIIAQDITLPTVNVSSFSDITCDSSTILIDGAGSSVGTNFTYLWTTSDGSFVSATNELSPTVDLNGTYELTITNVDNNCTNTGQVVIGVDTVAPIANTSGDQTLTCASSSVMLDASSSLGNSLSYIWSGPSIVSGGTTATPDVDADGTYQVIVTSSNGCQDSTTVEVIPDSNAPTADAGLDTSITCLSDNIDLNGSGSDIGPGIIYNWSTSDGNIVSGSSTLNPNVNASGTYLLVVTNTNNGCTNSSTVNVVVDTLSPTAIIDPGVVINCYDFSPIVDGSGSLGNGLSYNWSTTNGNIVSGIGTSQVEVDEAGTYTLEVISDNGCTDQTSISIVTDTISPIADFNANPSSGVIPLDVQFTNNSMGNLLSYNWDFGDGNSDTILDPSNIYQNDGDYNVVLTVTESNGCTDTAQLVISADGELVVVIPNVFTPNGDDQNDIFGADITNASFVEAVIFNRWGQVMYEWDGVNGGWDGYTTAGLLASEGTYFYIIKVTDLKGVQTEFVGSCMLKR